MRHRLQIIAIRIAVCAITFALLWATPANATWSKAASKTSGLFGMATLSYRFTPIASETLSGTSTATGGTTYTSTTDGEDAADLIDVTNTSSVSASPLVSIAVTSHGVQSTPLIWIYACSVAWNISNDTCSTGATTIAGEYSASTSPIFAWGNVAPQATLHIEVLAAFTYGTVNMTATVNSSAVRSGIDRTAG
jgi:hypothetical protein